jgi:hypothetical protein
MERFLRLSPARLLRPHHLLNGAAELLEAVRDMVDAAAKALGDSRWVDAVILLDEASLVLRSNHRCDQLQDRRGLPRRDRE